MSRLSVAFLATAGLASTGYAQVLAPLDVTPISISIQVNGDSVSGVDSASLGPVTALIDANYAEFTLTDVTSQANLLATVTFEHIVPGLSGTTTLVAARRHQTSSFRWSPLTGCFFASGDCPQVGRPPVLANATSSLFGDSVAVPFDPFILDPVDTHVAMRPAGDTVRWQFAIRSCTQSGSCGTLNGSNVIRLEILSLIADNLTECSDSLDNDGDSQIDLADLDCSDSYDATEAPPPPMTGCGLGPELALLLPPFWWMRRRLHGAS